MDTDDVSAAAIIPTDQCGSTGWMVCPHVVDSRAYLKTCHMHSISCKRSRVRINHRKHLPLKQRLVTHDTWWTEDITANDVKAVQSIFDAVHEEEEKEANSKR